MESKTRFMWLAQAEAWTPTAIRPLPYSASLIRSAKYVNGLALMVTDETRAKKIQIAMKEGCRQAIPETKTKKLYHPKFK